jgi:hypothetical protein
MGTEDGINGRFAAVGTSMPVSEETIPSENYGSNSAESNIVIRRA